MLSELVKLTKYPSLFPLSVCNDIAPKTLGFRLSLTRTENRAYKKKYLGVHPPTTKSISNLISLIGDLLLLRHLVRLLRHNSSATIFVFNDLNTVLVCSERFSGDVITISGTGLRLVVLLYSLQLSPSVLG